jgi:predicted ATPase
MPVSSNNPFHDVEIKLGTLPRDLSNQDNRKLRYASAFLTHSGESALQIWDVQDGEYLLVRYSDGVEFWLDGGFRRLWAQWPSSSSLENTLSYLVGPIMGLLLRLRGGVCLHASAVNITDRAIIFVGSEGAGKSTTAAAFARQGFPVLCDDIVALIEREQQFHVLPAYRRINLWPDSVKLLYGSPGALRQITADWEKRCLELGEDGGTRFEERALPIGAIYVLGDSTPNSAESVASISQKAAMMTLVTNTYATNFINAKQRAGEFAVLGRLVTGVPVRKINAERGTLHVDELCAVIQRDFSSLK